VNPEDQSRILLLGSEPRVVVRRTSEQHNTVIYGSPTLHGGDLTDPEMLDRLARAPIVFLPQLDGEFVVTIETDNFIHMGSDRFSSHPIFYSVDKDKLVISFEYQSMWNWLSQQNKLVPDSAAFYEFLHFQRLFHETTLDRKSKFLPPATLLTINKSTGKSESKRYWLPSFEKRDEDREEIAYALAQAVKSSIKTKTADSNKVSLLLSGGMDSRVALGGFTGMTQPHCLTVGEFENNEVDVAKSLARLTNANHSFVQRSTSHYAEVLAKAATTGGGMYSYQHGHFFDLDIPPTDLLLHGHGFDYYFQGMYLPATRKKFLGRSTRSWELAPPMADDVVSHYSNEAKYRLKGIDPTQLLTSEAKAEMQIRITADLHSTLAPIEHATNNAIDKWDYLTTSAPGRHYTYLNLLSAGTLAEQRTIAFTNNILDIYYSTPAEVRHGTQLLAETIKALNPELLTVRNANTNLRPDLSPTRLTIDGVLRGLKRRTGLGGRHSADPSAEDRSWPTDAMIASESPIIKDKISNLANSEAIESLNIFDLAKIAVLVDNANQGKINGASALLSLLTIEEFLSTT
jgi:hypothetical protein